MSNDSSRVDWMELAKPVALPSSEDQVFSSQEDWWNNACVNWCRDGWGLYATGYKRAADLLIEHVERRCADQDTLVYPALFLYRQYLELQIKDLVRVARKLKDIPGDFPKIHNIGSLWDICHSLISNISPGDSVSELSETGRLIREFSVVDPTSMAFVILKTKKETHLWRVFVT